MNLPNRKMHCSPAVKYLLIALIFSFIDLKAQIDSVFFDQDILLVGQINGMQNSVLSIETEFSDQDFQIEWKKIRRIQTQSTFRITTVDLDKYYGTINSSRNGTLTIRTDDTTVVQLSIPDIVSLEEYNEKFFDRISANIDVGLDLAKAQNLRSLSTRSGISYHYKKWVIDLTYSSVVSSQDSVETIKRNESNLNIIRILPSKWYIVGTSNTLSNTEQNLDLRLNAQLGLGRHIFQNNFAYWSLKLGSNRNTEYYATIEEPQRSWEGYFATEFNIYDVENYQFKVYYISYPSFTESGRWRSDSTIDLKFDLPLSFYVRAGISLNYDNRPAPGASKTDYVAQTGFGWEL